MSCAHIAVRINLSIELDESLAPLCFASSIKLPGITSLTETTVPSTTCNRLIF